MKQMKLLVRLTFVAGMFASLSLADVITFEWSTTGVFSAPGLPAGLTFTGASGSTGSTDANGNLAGINLGQFNFPDITTDYTGTFTFNIQFTQPAGAQNPVFNVTVVADANVTGQGNSENDRFTIDFPAASAYTFGGLGLPSGTFLFNVNDVSDFRTGSQPDTANLLGDISGASLSNPTAGAPAAVPEPGTLSLLATVLGGLAFGLKRKKSQSL